MKLEYNAPKRIRYKGIEYNVHSDAINILETLILINDENIDDIERAIIIVTKIFGTEAPIEQSLVDKASEIMNNGKVVTDQEKETKQTMDLIQDFQAIRADIIREYAIDVTKDDVSWSDFLMYVGNLSEKSSIHTLSKIRGMNLKDIKDPKERKRVREIQDSIALERYKKREVTESIFEKAMRVQREKGVK